MGLFVLQSPPLSFELTIKFERSGLLNRSCVSCIERMAVASLRKQAWACFDDCYPPTNVNSLIFRKKNSISHSFLLCFEYPCRSIIVGKGGGTPTDPVDSWIPWYTGSNCNCFFHMLLHIKQFNLLAHRTKQQKNVILNYSNNSFDMLPLKRLFCQNYSSITQI